MPDDPAAISNQEINNLTGRGLTVVASCGNFIEQNVENPTSPAKNKHVIGVSGYEPQCDFATSDPPTELNSGRYAVTVPDITDAVDSEPIYCGYEDYDSGGCLTCSQCELDEAVWEGNVQYDLENGKPDVLAPVKYPTVSRRNVRQKVGTSYAAPIVTAAVGRCLSALADLRDPSSEEIRKKISQTGIDIGAEQGCKLDATELEAALRPSSVSSVLSAE